MASNTTPQVVVVDYSKLWSSELRNSFHWFLQLSEQLISLVPGKPTNEMSCAGNYRNQWNELRSSNHRLSGLRMFSVFLACTSCIIICFHFLILLLFVNLFCLFIFFVVHLYMFISRNLLYFFIFNLFIYFCDYTVPMAISYSFRSRSRGCCDVQVHHYHNSTCDYIPNTQFSYWYDFIAYIHVLYAYSIYDCILHKIWNTIGKYFKLLKYVKWLFKWFF